MINLTCSYCGERMEFGAVRAIGRLNRGIYWNKCINAGSQCPTSNIYRNLPQSIHQSQIIRFTDNLNEKSKTKERKWKRSIQVERFRAELEKN